MKQPNHNQESTIAEFNIRVGDVFIVNDKQYLIGDVNLLFGVCDDCVAFYPNAKCKWVRNVLGESTPSKKKWKIPKVKEVKLRKECRFRNTLKSDWIYDDHLIGMDHGKYVIVNAETTFKYCEIVDDNA